MAHQFIIMIIKSFPSMYWSSNNLSALLEIQSALYQGNDNGKTTFIISVKIKKNFNMNNLNNMNKTSLSSITNNNNTNNMNNNNMNNNEMIEEEEYEEYYLPENYSDRCKLFESFNRFTLSWISKSMTVAPNVTQTALQHYLIKFQQSDVSSLRHFGYTFAVYLSTPIEHLQAVGSNILLKSDKRGFSILSQDQVSLTQSISVMSFSSGQANSLKLMLGKRSAESMIINQLSNLMKLYNNNNMNNNMNNTTNMNGNGNNVNVKFYEQLSDTMKLATAFVLIWLPVYIFTKESMDIAIYCWNWIASVKSNDFNIPLLSEISNAWQFTIQKGYGLFSGHHEKDEAVELAVQSNNQSNTTTNTIIKPINSIKPIKHLIMYQNLKYI
ncbi:predicted protein [Naegleria gruberi]|uniref:Predicted protein n=1 Tax=Naegleria gruberi TaxID=5762 RepID=D2W4S4_NAEGR|nr:uncharacterized protein NAEGRDRAFT_76410 [Naegleria gruberi]EFC35927.1 predicted protein [Naegleria gruberi]|eukprot:XP_002668671.1 predicted protein [Naegleria gruberi strain NEG-M]